jgi:hypothetical protein
VRDLSLRSAVIGEAFPDVPVNTPIKLFIDGITAELSGFTVRKDAAATLIKLELSEAATKIASEWGSTRLAA